MFETITPQLLELNFCKNPLCADFGSLNLANYSILNDRQYSQIACASCHTISPTLWPDELDKELTSQAQYRHADLSACGNKKCDNFANHVQLYPHSYYSFGFSGEKQRYRCKQCKKTFVDQFSIANPHLKIHVTILALLLTGFSLREITSKLKIQAKTLNDHINTMASICRHKSSIFDHHWQNQSQKFSLVSNCCALQPNSNNGVLWVCTSDSNSHYITHQSFNIAKNYTLADRRIINKEYLASINTPCTMPIDEKLPSLLNALISDHKNRSDRSNPLHNQTQLNYPLKSGLVTPIYCATAHFNQLNQWLENKQHLIISMNFEPMLAQAAMTSFNRMRQKQCLDLLYQVDDLNWMEGKGGGKPQPLLLKETPAPWSISEQWHLKTDSDQRAICQLVESTLTQQQAHQLPKLTPLTDYMTRFHAMFKTIVNEPRRRRRPEGLLPLLDIYKAWNNLCHQETPGETPAVKAKISEKPLSLDQLLQ
ncbi:hypothetical protein A9264_14680 [Vibrio sp. UCD-FRSSP16_10]|uniref:hypothetical protein n=1 Tax=unclassified Vibrio TaxID=2614977 RepID=UPI000800B4A7|nr:MULTISPECIES: hypothetical protein [unclassified Vibrio]OBT09481.1 hypothetical protein A9260_06565 [Vibrio sp. UCD-FRSSP16_30]OBT19523.1 hypothetical protein A9264_14680 [Vibrio sp. UCD-FRSSP16_10]